MKFHIAVREFFWPWLDKFSPEEIERQEERRRDDKVRIDALDLNRESDVALDEARRMADGEAERRRGTDQKAATYLPLVAALIPLILTVVSALWERKAGTAPGWLNMPLLGLAVAYTAGAGLWAFRVLEVTTSHEAGLGDFELAWSKPKPTQTFARRILLYTRLNQDRINWKVSCIKMAHAFLLRAFITFSLLLILNIVWYLVALAWEATGSTSSSLAASSSRKIADADHFAERLKVTDAWTALNAQCRSRSGGKNGLHARVSNPSPIAALPTALQPAPNERGAFRDIQFSCDGRTVAHLRARYLPSRLIEPSMPIKLPEPLNSSGTSVIVALKQEWASTNLGPVSGTVPPLIRQTVLLRAPGGRPVAIVETEIFSNNLGY